MRSFVTDWSKHNLHKNRMRVFYDHQVFSLQDAGGVSRYQYELIRNLQRLDPGALEAKLWMGRNSNVMPFSALRDSNTSIHGSATSLRPGYVRYGINEVTSALLSQSWGTFDIYHTMLYRAIPFVHRRSLIVTHHDCTHERFPQLFHNAAFIIEKKRKLFRAANAILCVSQSSQLDLQHFYDVPAEKTFVIHHGFSPLPAPPEVAEVTSERMEPYLLYVGSRSEYKNFSLLLEAFSRGGLAADYRLLVIGGGDFTPEEQAKLNALGLANRVRLIARANEAALAAAYRQAALFVYPSMYEGFGFPPLEAMSLGCPVLVNRTSSLPEICGDAAFYFDQTDAEELARVLATTLDDASGRAAKRQLGEERVKLYDWALTAAKTLDVYRACART